MGISESLISRIAGYDVASLVIWRGVSRRQITREATGGAHAVFPFAQINESSIPIVHRHVGNVSGCTGWVE